MKLETSNLTLETAPAHPRKNVVPVEVGLAWGNENYLFQEKLDGFFDFVEMSGHIFTGEMMPHPTRGRRLVVWDCVAAFGKDIRGQTTDYRWQMVQALCPRLGLAVVESSNNGGELLRRVLARGGEGIVRKNPWGTYYDEMTACKRSGVWRCIVTGHVPGSQSVTIKDADTGEDRGRVTLRGGKCDAVRAGSIIRVEGMNLTEAGKIRQPVPAREWLLKF
jgi:hypothetical protein